MIRLAPAVHEARFPTHYPHVECQIFPLSFPFSTPTPAPIPPTLPIKSTYILRPVCPFSRSLKYATELGIIAAYGVIIPPLLDQTRMVQRVEG
ncbi:hypothetical protein CVT25_008671 [Psilocybe cyanescens]|uniref:Uncharacterized protein n=1 Tax=Psilocybe cyanescens TaxID=93625 RepID=A0A409XLA9_PSICY|nr:hypothetical protein CVT25_008671 [Psilocybe cyanescens]